MLYAREQTIRRDKLIISHTEKRYLRDRLTLENLQRIVKPNEVFDICQVDEDESYYLIEIHSERYETDAEQAERIAKQERYNENRLNYLAEKGRIIDMNK